MSVTVITNPGLRVTGATLLAPASTQFPQGIPATVIPTVPVPPTVGTLKTGQWIMDPSGEFVLILDGQKGLVLYQVVGAGDPTSGQFQGLAVWGPNGATGVVFCAQADGNAVVYDKNFPEQLNPTWHANNGPSSAQYLFVLENGSFAVVQYSAVWGSPPDITFTQAAEA